MGWVGGEGEHEKGMRKGEERGYDKRERKGGRGVGSGGSGQKAYHLCHEICNSGGPGLGF